MSMLVVPWRMPREPSISRSRPAWEKGSDLRLELACSALYTVSCALGSTCARLSLAFSMTVRERGISCFIFTSCELLIVSRPTLHTEQDSVPKCRNA